MRTRRLFTTTMALLAVPFAVTALASTASAAPATPAHHTAKGAAGKVVVTTEHTNFGNVLATGSGGSLYVFSGDGFPFSPTGTPQLNCTALNTAPAPASTACTTAWPPLVASGPLVAKGGVKQKGLSTVTRNGVTQVTYFGKPVYRFAGDTAAHQVNGEDIAAFDGTWYLDHTNGVQAVEVPTVNTEVSPNGIVLSSPTASGGRTLYLLTSDTKQMSACTGPCAALWPPLLTSSGHANAGQGVNRGKFGTVRRADGTTQVTYAGHPVYFFAFDLGAGAPAGLTNGEYLLDPAPVDGAWYTVLPQGLPNPGTTTVGSEPSGGTNILQVTGGFTHVQATLYAFTADSPTSSMCSGQCAMIWPPVMTTTPAAVSGMANGAKLGTIERKDGTFQVTYNGHPLYFFAKALDSGTEGNNVTAFGGTFNTVNVSGAIG
jgi:predicted lipoprotein with Yx(FWY)xxD motif